MNLWRKYTIHVKNDLWKFYENWMTIDGLKHKTRDVEASMRTRVGVLHKQSSVSSSKVLLDPDNSTIPSPCLTGSRSNLFAWIHFYQWPDGRDQKEL